MALYAYDGKKYIFAADAEGGILYQCLECHRPVKVRRVRNRISHFFHLKKSPYCRLYSKSEDHLFIQLQIQQLLPPETTQMECPLASICRIADLLWEKEKIVFEIQCSSIEISEAQNRISDYQKLGYKIVWLLDDRVFNKPFVRPAEAFLRNQTAYFFSFRKNQPASFYDQMEIIGERKRLRKGESLLIDLSKPTPVPSLEWPVDLPTQIQRRIKISEFYFPGDILHKAIQSPLNSATVLHLEKWRRLEITLQTAHLPNSVFAQLFTQFVCRPYLKALEWLLEKADC
jgi:competence protein CoiA